MNRKEISERLIKLAEGIHWDGAVLREVLHRFDLSLEECVVIRSFMRGHTQPWRDLQDLALRIADGSIAQSCP